MSETTNDKKPYTIAEIREFNKKRLEFLNERLRILKLEDECERLERRIAENRTKRLMWMIREANLVQGPPENQDAPENEEMPEIGDPGTVNAQEEETPEEKPARVVRQLRREA